MADRSWFRWGMVLGFAIGGFFDGILLHQILQWHHLLSLVPGVDTIRAQVLWDGYFHALMYVVAGAGLWGLWRTDRGSGQRSGRLLASALLIGFGLWHVVDALLSHWLLGIHRIRLDSPNPLLWDLAWLAGFGLLPLLLGLVSARRGPRINGPRGPFVALLIVSLLTGSAAAWSLKPPADQRFTTIVFAPWTSPAAGIDAVLASGGRLLWTDRHAAVMVVEVPPERRWSFYRRGALLVSGAGLPNGCFSWARN